MSAPQEDKTADPGGKKNERSDGETPGGAAPEKTKIVASWKHSSPFLSCRFDPTGKYVFAGAEDFSVQRWEVETGKATAFLGHESWVRGIAFHRESRTLLTGGFDGRLIWWDADAEKPRPVRTVETGHGWVRAVAVSPDGTLVATAGNDHLVKLWAFESGELAHTFGEHECHVYNVLFYPGNGIDSSIDDGIDGQVLVSADLKGVVKHWQVGKEKSIRQLDASALYKYDSGFRADIGGVRSMAFSGDGKLLACGGITNVTNAFAGVGSPCVVVLDWESGKISQKHVAKKKDLRGVAWGVALHADGFLIGASGGGGGGFLFFWKPGEEHEFSSFKLPNTARDLDLHPDGMRVVTVHHDRHIRVSRMGSASS